MKQNNLKPSEPILKIDAGLVYDNSNILKDIKLDINSNVVRTHDLDKIENIGYKFIDDYLIFDTDNEAENENENENENYIWNWGNSLNYLIKNKLKDNLTYSLAVQGRNIETIDIITFCPHLLVTNKINIDSLITFIGGQIDSFSLNTESDGVDGDFDIFYKYRIISIIKKINETISEFDYLEFNKKKKNKNKSLRILKNNKLGTINNKILSFLKVLPNENVFNRYGYIVNKNWTKNGLNGILYNYSYEYKFVFIFIYEKTENKNKGIVYKFDSVTKNLYKYIDFIDSRSDEYDIIREINNNIIYYRNGKVLFIEEKLKSKLITKLNIDIKYDNKFGTFDIECYLDKVNNKTYTKEELKNKKEKFIPFACKWKIKKINKEYYLTNFNNYEEMFDKCFIDIMENCNDYNIYAHNLSSFDGILILKSLYRNFNVKIKFKDNKIMIFKVSKQIKNKNKTIKLSFNFVCSLNLLPLKLVELIEAFNIDKLKLPFPYKFITKDNLNYIGEIPDFEYYKDIINIEEYLKLYYKFNKDNPWNLKLETMKYLNNDVESLYEIIEKFSKDIYSLENLNITKSISISSLALRTFLTNYYDHTKTPIKIPRLNQYKDIKEAYFGGRVELYKTYAENIYWYDVNSLYPTVMLKDLPIGDTIKSTDPNLDNYFGYCYVTVNVPENIYNPILPFRDENGNVYNCTGSWKGWYSSELLKYARDNQNVTITVHFGYKFDRGKDIFKEYVEHYFNLKKEAEINNNEGKRFLSKLMLNSLSGRFGLKYNNIKIKFVTSSQAKELSLKYQILENIIIDEENDLELIKYTLEPSDVLKDIDQKSYLDLISKKNNTNEDFISRSLPISAMITSYAMIYMHKFLNIPGNECYYSDTDSVILQKPLDSKYVGNDLGQFKYKGKIKKGYFISPKLYCLVSENGEKVIKSKGIESKELNENDFIDMLYGITIKKKNIYKFNRDLNKLTINYNKSNYIIKPENLKRESIYNNYNLIVNTKPLQVKDGILKQKELIKLIFNLVLYNPNKYALVFIN